MYDLEGIDLKAIQEFPFLENFMSKIYLNRRYIRRKAKEPQTICKTVCGLL